MNMNGKILCVLMVFLLSAMPMAACAEPLGEKVLLTGPFACEYLDIDSVEIARIDEGLLVTLLFHLHDGLSQEQLANLEIISFNLMSDAETTEFPDTFISGSMGRADGQPLNATEPGVAYMDQSLWQPVEQLPGVLYLRPFYKFMGEWGEALVLEIPAGAVQQIESAGELPARY